MFRAQDLWTYATCFVLCDKNVSLNVGVFEEGAYQTVDVRRVALTPQEHSHLMKFEANWYSGDIEVTLRAGSSVSNLKSLVTVPSFPGRVGLIGLLGAEFTVSEFSRFSQAEQERHASDPGKGQRKHVFLSYCREDEGEAAALRADLLSAGFSVWWDRDISPGQDWKNAIREAIRTSSAFVLCLSSRAVSGSRSGIFPEAFEAIGLYRQHAPGCRFLFPVRFTHCEIPLIEIDDTRTLDRIQYVDLFPAASRGAGISRLVASLKELTS